MISIVVSVSRRTKKKNERNDGTDCVQKIPKVMQQETLTLHDEPQLAGQATSDTILNAHPFLLTPN